MKASSVFLEEEAEYHVQKLIDMVRESLASDCLLGRDVGTVLWRTPFYGTQVRFFFLLLKCSHQLSSVHFFLKYNFFDV